MKSPLERSWCSNPLLAQGGFFVVQLLNFKGLFYRSGDQFWVEDWDTSEHILVDLGPLDGLECMMVAAHIPPPNPDESLWGAGGCKWQPAPCPFGHHVNPQNYLKVSHEGCLESAFWRVGGHHIPITFLEGHYGLLVLYSQVGLDSPTPQDDLQEQLVNLKNIISTIRSF